MRPMAEEVVSGFAIQNFYLLVFLYKYKTSFFYRPSGSSLYVPGLVVLAGDGWWWNG